eukprot:52657-Hanusia_phi.AAC.4
MALEEPAQVTVVDALEADLRPPLSPREGLDRRHVLVRELVVDEAHPSQRLHGEHPGKVPRALERAVVVDQEPVGALEHQRREPLTPGQHVEEHVVVARRQMPVVAERTGPCSCTPWRPPRGTGAPAGCGRR